jgi:hypothetical protein
MLNYTLALPWAKEKKNIIFLSNFEKRLFLSNFARKYYSC